MSIDYQIRQRGRASIDFIADLGMQAGAGYTPKYFKHLNQIGLGGDGLAEDLDERIAQVNEKLAGFPAFQLTNLVGDFLGDQHGRIAAEAFEEIHEDIDPLIKLAYEGPTELHKNPDLEVPRYWKGVEFHRTTGGWDGHPHMGFVHGELIHKTYVAKNYPGDIFAQRGEIARMARKDQYNRIVEFGTSSGHYTVPLQEAYPEAEIWGCDLSLEMLEHAARVANSNGWAWKLHRVAAEDTGFESESFDLATSFILLHELPASAIRNIFKEAFRILEPGGDLIFSDVRPFWDMDRLTEWRAYFLAVYGGEPYWRESATLDLAEVAREAGFEEAKTFGLGDNHYPWVTTARKPG